jgi:hypothetical protein
VKNIENLLLLTAAVVLCWPHIDGSTYDLHLHDTYFVIAFRRFFLTELLLVLFLFYKIIRKRHHSVNRLMAVTHVFLTILFIATVLYAYVTVQTLNTSRGYLDYSNWQNIRAESAVHNLVLLGFVVVFSIIQIIFFLYFIIRLIQQPLPVGNDQ